MSPLDDLFDGDPDFEYHQDYRGEEPWLQYTRASFIVPFLVTATIVGYQILLRLDNDLLPLPELIWNGLVYITPSRLLDIIETYQSPLRIANPALAHIPRTHAAKSETMRRILGLDTAGGIIGSVAQAGRRRLSTLPGINKGDGRPPGLGNWDNSCYQNSVLQGLASLDSLSGYLMTTSIEDGALEAVDMKMAESLRGLIATLNDPANNGRRIWTPATLKNMSSWQQQDAQEYFSKVLDEIDKEVGKVANIMRTSQGLESDDDISTGSGTTETLPISIFRNPLEGLIAQRVGCTTCGYSEGLSIVPFNCLTVPLGRSWEYDVSNCLDEYTKLEQIEGVECGKCTLLKMERLLSIMKERAKDSPTDSPLYKNTIERLAAVTEALEDDDYEEKTLLQKCAIPAKSRVSSTKTRQAVIARPPKSLVVHINRSLFNELTGELNKNHAEVRFPKILDLGPWCLGSSGSANDMSTEEWLLNPDQPMIASTGQPSRLLGPLYELRAVVTHYGRHENGHYICYKKHPTPVSDKVAGELEQEQWWRLSDDDVMKVSEEHVLSQGGVFMLFFDCIEPARLITSAPTQSVLAMSVETLPSDLEVAINIPLPNDEDSNISEPDSQESLSMREQSTTTSISDHDEEEADEHENATQEYKPTKAIIISTYIQKTSVHNEDEGVGQQGVASPSGSLLMV